MNQRKIGTLPLCCLMIGAVLGSGIIILPPLAIEAAGDWAIIGWGATTLFGIAFAYLFAKIGTLFPGDGGAANAVERAFGPSAKLLASATLSCAVLFGPAAVILTIIQYLPPGVAPESPVDRALLAAVIQISCAILVVSGLKNMSHFTMLLASTATILLLTGAGLTLFFHSAPPAPLPPVNTSAMGYTMLLLFWAVVGWEVVGNFGAEVVNPRRTVPRAAVIAALIIGLVSMAVAAGLQYGHIPAEAGHGVASLLFPLFGTLSPWVMAGLTTALCVTTYLMIIGAVSRLVAHLSQETGLPDILNRRNRFGVPWVVVLGYTIVHLFQFFLIALGILDLAMIVAIADGFFLANALLGTLAAVRLFTSPLPRAVATVLCIGVFLVFLQSHWQVLAAIGCMALLLTYRARRRTIFAR